MKYIVIERKLKRGMVEVLPIAFPNNLNHSDVAKAITNLIMERGKETVSVVSAGFLNIPVVNTHGESETLKISSDPMDCGVFASVDYFPIRQK